MRKKKEINAPRASVNFKRLAVYFKGYRLTLALSAVCSALTALLTLAVPVLVGRAVNLALGPGEVDFAGISRILIMIAACAGGYALFGWLGSAANNRAAFGIVRDIRAAAALKLTRLPLSYLDAHPQGELLSRMTADADIVGDGLLLAFTNFTSAAVTMVGALVMMFVFSPAVAAAVVLLTPVSVFVAAKVASSISSSFRKASEERGALTKNIEQYVSGRKTVAAFSREEEVCRDFDRAEFELAKTQKKAIFFSSLVNPTTRVINNVIYAVIAAGGAFAVTNGNMDVGTLTAFLAYSVQYTKPFNEISGVVAELQNALVCAGRIFDMIDAPEEPDDSLFPPFGFTGEQEIAFDHASFSYVPEKPLIRDLDIRVEPGEHIAIVGPTGCGKTTLINLLMRFYDVNGGSLTVGGRDVREMRREDLRSMYGMVLQDTWLARGTVAENIAYGKPDATREEIVAAAKSAHAHGFITRLPQGYDTVIGGDDGLSNGQKQLLCIARVMLRDPPVLILDEATSSVDTATEHRIQAAFEELCRGRTSFIVAHRLSTVRSCDRILVMRDGDIVETGTHDELMALNGFYAELYNSRVV